jgi:CubicO group peptidase (beta-lactamase class C family)
MACLRTSSFPSLVLAALVALAACDAAPPVGDGADPAPEAELGARSAPGLPAHLDARVVEHVEQYGRQWAAFRFHGAVLVMRGDEVAVDRAFGLADLAVGVTNEPGTAFRIGTLSAQLTAIATLRLAEAGVLRVHDPVAHHLPDWPGGDRITLEHLLSHRSGIPSFTEGDAFEAVKHAPRTLPDLLALFRDLPLDFEPGTETAPSNSNTVLLGAVLEAATGKPYAQVVAEHVLAPAGMEHTHYALCAEPQAVGMTYHEDDYLELVRGVHPSAFGPAGGWLSTTGDLRRLYHALGRGSLLSRRSVAEMLGGGPAGGLGYGWAPTEVVGRTAAAWPGLIDGFNSAVIHVPEDDTTIVVLSNSEVVPAGPLAEEIAALVYGEEVPRREEAQVVPVPIDEQLPAVGRYVPTRGTEAALAAANADSEPIAEVFVLRDGEHLVLAVPGHGTKRMHPLGKGRFFFKDGARTRAEVSLRADQSALLVLEATGGELRFVRMPAAG